jgi:hypothetical protein
MGLGRDPLKPSFLNPPPHRKTLGHRREIWLKSSGKVSRRSEWRRKVWQVGVPFCCPLNYIVVGARFHLVTFCLRWCERVRRNIFLRADALQGRNIS